jgi:cytochrome c oxidase subunit II
LAPRPGRSLLACALVLLGALLLAAPAQAISLAPEAPRSPNAESIALTYWVMLALAAALLVAVHVALIAAVLRFRARRGRRPSRVAAGRGGLRPAVGALSLIAAAVFTFGVIMTAQVRDVEPSGPGGLEAAETAQVGVSGLPAPSPEDAEPGEAAPLEIEAIAQQWAWRFEYPGGQPGQRTFSYGELVVPVDTTVVLEVSSIDVLHSWWVPALGGQVQAAPGTTTQTWFKADEEGRYAGASTTFSGTGYPSLRAWVRVVSVPEYLAYIERLEEDLAEAQEAVAQADVGVVAEPEGDEPQ